MSENKDHYVHFTVSVDKFNVSYQQHKSVEYLEMDGEDDGLVISESVNLEMYGDCRLVKAESIPMTSHWYVSGIFKPAIQVHIKVKDIQKVRADLTILPNQLSSPYISYLSKIKSSDPRLGMISLKFDLKESDVVDDYSGDYKEVEEIVSEYSFNFDFVSQKIIFKSIDLSLLDLTNDELSVCLVELNQLKYLQSVSIKLHSLEQLQLLTKSLQYNIIIECIFIKGDDQILQFDGITSLKQFVKGKRWINLMQVNDTIVYNKCLVIN